MEKYDKLVEALRCGANRADKNHNCEKCRYYSNGCLCTIAMDDAATAIEELDAEETRLLLITSELQDKVVELEEELNDADIAADDNGWQVEELQAEVERLQAQLPKRGEIVRCRECRWGHLCVMGQHLGLDGFCSKGEREVQE